VRRRWNDCTAERGEAGFYDVRWSNGDTAVYPSVTQIIGAGHGIIEDRPEWRAARERGTLVHACAARMLTGGSISLEEFNGYDMDTKQNLMAMQRFMDETHPVVRHVEVLLLHHELQVAGRADLVCLCPGVLFGGLLVGDLKTGRMRLDDELMQLTAYAACYLAMDHRRRLLGVFSLHLNPDGSYLVTKRTVQSLFASRYWTEFVNLRNTHFEYDERSLELWNSQHSQ